MDVAYVNEPTKRRSTTGFDFTFSGGAAIYTYKNQSINELSSTESELIYTVTDAKNDRLLRSMLQDLGFTQEYHTTIYKDNDPTIDIVNSSIPTEINHHIDVRLFAIQSWKEFGDIIMNHIPGIINPVDDITKPLG